MRTVSAGRLGQSALRFSGTVAPCIALLANIFLLSACAGGGTRLRKQLVSPSFVFEAQPSAAPVLVTYHNGYRDELPVTYGFVDAGVEGRHLVQPPLMTRAGWIEVTPLENPLLVKVYVSDHARYPAHFFEIKGVTGHLEGEMASEVRFLSDVTPTSDPVQIYMENLTNPYNPYSLHDGALVLVEVIDPSTQKVWRYLFSYRSFGSRQKLSFNIVFNIPPEALTAIGLDWNARGVGNAAFTMSYSIGYRLRTKNPVLNFVGDKTAMVLLVGTSTAPFEGRKLFDNLSLGLGIELYDFISLNLLMDTDAIGNLSSGQWGIVVGFDAYRFADFSRKLTSKLSHSNVLK